ncbi:Uncharacterized protein Adt_24767 [Abeliophyllum distichum]|uniref:Uncharacterized protein n=1 Tax=Abeliophyllum distichum TaxID=126358 RepID=A0ABD1SEP7_9LAMI
MPIRSRAQDRAALPDTQSNNPLTQPLLVTQSDDSSMPALSKKTRYVAQSNSITESHNNNVPARPKQTVTVRNRPENKDYAIWSYTLFAIGAVLTFAASVVLPEVRFYEEDRCGYIIGEGVEPETKTNHLFLILNPTTCTRNLFLILNPANLAGAAQENSSCYSIRKPLKKTHHVAQSNNSPKQTLPSTRCNTLPPRVTLPSTEYDQDYLLLLSLILLLSVEP